MIEFIDKIDTTIFLVFNGMRAPFLDTFMSVYTDRYVWIPLYIALILLLFRGGGLRGGIVFTIAAILAITLTDNICAMTIRPMVERLRPSNPENPLSEFVLLVDDYRGGPYGFPSCHSANSFALALFMLLFYRRKAMMVVMLLWAVLNAYTRLYLGVHYPGDLIAGAMIGGVISTLCYFATLFLILKHIGAFFPNFKGVASSKSLLQFIANRIEAPLFGLHLMRWRYNISASKIVWIVAGATLIWIVAKAM